MTTKYEVILHNFSSYPSPYCSGTGNKLKKFPRRIASHFLTRYPISQISRSCYQSPTLCTFPTSRLSLTVWHSSWILWTQVNWMGCQYAVVIYALFGAWSFPLPCIFTPFYLNTWYTQTGRFILLCFPDALVPSPLTWPPDIVSLVRAFERFDPRLCMFVPLGHGPSTKLTVTGQTRLEWEEASESSFDTRPLWSPSVHLCLTHRGLSPLYHIGIRKLSVRLVVIIFCIWTVPSFESNYLS